MISRATICITCDRAGDITKRGTKGDMQWKGNGQPSALKLLLLTTTSHKLWNPRKELEGAYASRTSRGWQRAFAATDLLDPKSTVFQL